MAILRIGQQKQQPTSRPQPGTAGTGTGSSQGSQGTTQDGHAHTEATTWALGLDDVDVAAVRRVVAAELASRSPWAQVRSLSRGRYRALSPVEVLLWTEQVVRVADRVDGDLAVAHARGAEPLERLPFAVVVTPDALVLRWHRSLAGHRDAQVLLQRLVAAAAPRRALAVAA